MQPAPFLRSASAVHPGVSHAMLGTPFCWHHTAHQYSTIRPEAPVEGPPRRAAAPRLLCLSGAGALLLLVPLLCSFPVFLFEPQPGHLRTVGAGPVSARAYHPRHPTQRHDPQLPHSLLWPLQRRAAQQWPLPSSPDTGTPNAPVSVLGTAVALPASGVGLGLMLFWMAAVVAAVLRLPRPLQWGAVAVAGSAEVPGEDAGPSDAADPQAESAGVCDMMGRARRRFEMSRPYLRRGTKGNPGRGHSPVTHQGAQCSWVAGMDHAPPHPPSVRALRHVETNPVSAR